MGDRLYDGYGRCGDAPGRFGLFPRMWQVNGTFSGRRQLARCPRRTCLVMGVTVCAQPQAASFLECAGG